MAYRVELLPAVERELRKLPPDARRATVARMEELAVDPRGAGTRKLSGKGDIYRILYQIADDVLLVLVVRVGHRRDVYRGL